MFEELYETGALDIIEENFEIDINNELKYTLCNLKLIDMFEIFSEYMDLRDAEFANTNIYSNIDGITFDHLYETLDNKEFLRSSIDRSFIKCYEFFESTIGEIIKYIHYKKLDIVLNKDNSITCDRLKNKSIEQLTEELIEINVGKIVYNKGIKDMLSFITRYTKKDIDEQLINAIFIQSKIRNALVHDNGVIDKRMLTIMKGLYEYDSSQIPQNDEIHLFLEMDSIIGAIDIYKDIIKQIIQAMKLQFEI